MLVKVPEVAFSAVLLLAIVGLGEVLQHTPLPVMGLTPGAVRVPPVATLVLLMPVAAVVVTVGRETGMLMTIWPLPVLVAAELGLVPPL